MKKPALFETSSPRRNPPSGTSTIANFPPATGEGVKLPPARKLKPVGLLEEHFPDSEADLVSFEYFNPTAREVFLAGSFNGWQTRATPMTPQRGGKWSAEVLLRPGRYEYRLVVDGQWLDDPMAERFAANPYGGLNCVIEVKSAMTPAADPGRGMLSDAGGVGLGCHRRHR